MILLYLHKDSIANNKLYSPFKPTLINPSRFIGNLTNRISLMNSSVIRQL